MQGILRNLKNFRRFWGVLWGFWMIWAVLRDFKRFWGIPLGFWKIWVVLRDSRRFRGVHWGFGKIWSILMDFERPLINVHDKSISKPATSLHPPPNSTPSSSPFITHYPFQSTFYILSISIYIYKSLKRLRTWDNTKKLL